MEKRISKKSSLIIAGDIGGTHTRLGIFSVSRGGLRPVREETFSSPAYAGLKDILREFLERGIRIDSACFGVAGPVIRQSVKTTNLPWVVSAAVLKKELQIDRVKVINDLVANAYGIAMLGKKDVKTLNKGKKMEGNAGLISAGTGLGEALLFWNGKKHIPSPSEGGHVEFGPRNQAEIELLQYLLKEFDHVSYERILSGSGINRIYEFLRNRRESGPEPDWLSESLKKGDPAAAIAEAAQEKKDTVCAETMDLFVSIYGAAASNLALKMMAVGGVYVGGGIAPRIIWKLEEGTFMKAFKDKGRYSEMMARIPVQVIMNDRTALLGAARRAAELLEQVRGVI